MSLLNSLFDVQNVDNPMALAALAQVLPTSVGETFNTNGTPLPGSIEPGMVVTYNTSGQAVLATTEDISAGNQNKQLVFITLDGNADFSGAFTQVLTVLHGGMTIITDQFSAGAYMPGLQVTFSAGLIELVTSPTTQQAIGFVGPAGLNTTTTPSTLQVILPQGMGI